jgi:hypothetical protein
LVIFSVGEHVERLEIEEAQRVVCSRYDAAFVSTSPDDKIGFATATAGLQPVNGLRHPQTAGTSGWYIWCGESFSESPDFFKPLHASHIYESLPDTSHLFGLPPGFRFLLAGDYLDVWFDERLLAV